MKSIFISSLFFSLIWIFSSCDIFSGEEEVADITDFGLVDSAESLYKFQLDKYLGIERKKLNDPDKIFGVWYGGELGEDGKGFEHHVYFQITPQEFKSILVCSKIEPFLAGIVETVSTLGLYESGLTIGEAGKERSLFISKEGKEFACDIGPVPRQSYSFDLKNGQLTFSDKLTDYELHLSRYY